MTTEKLVKTLRYCSTVGMCDDCWLKTIQEEFGAPFCDDKLKQKAADLIEQQAARIAELEANVPKWIPCSERVPELPNGRRCNRAVIVCVRGHVMPLIYERSIVRGKTVERWKWMWDRICDDPESITHWMPLPEPPETEGGCKDG